MEEEAEFIKKILGCIRECELIVHKWNPYIQFVCAFTVTEHENVYMTSLVADKQFCRPLFWIAGLMMHQTKGQLDGDFESMLHTYNMYQNANEIPNLAMVDYDVITDPAFFDAIAELRSICNEIVHTIEEREWMGSWFISYEYLCNQQVKHEYFSTNLYFQAYPAITVAMYLLRGITIHNALGYFSTDVMEANTHPEYQLMSTYNN